MAETSRDGQAWSLLLDDACRRIASHLRAHHHEFVMLKGATIAHWLYDDPSARTYIDLDVLVAPSAEAAVVQSLREIGFAPLLDPAARRALSPEEQPLRDRLGVVVDLHVAIKGIRLDPESAWVILKSETEPWEWAGTPVLALAPTARAMHLALHLAQSGLTDEKAALDLRLGLERLEPNTWRDAAGLAGRLDADEAFVAGLRLLPDGARLAERFGMAPPTHAETSMRAAAASHSALAVERVLTASGRRERIALVRALLFPSSQWMRLFHQGDVSTPWRMFRARLFRPFVVLGRVPAAMRERHRHRRGMRSNSH